MDNIDARSPYRSAPAAVVVVGPGVYSVDGVGLTDPAEIFDLLQAQGVGRIEMRIDPDASTDYDRIGKLIFSLARHGWKAESADSLHWKLKTSAH